MTDAPHERARAVLAFWFGGLDEHGLPDRSIMRNWFAGGEAFDMEIRRRFPTEIEAACSPDDWPATPQGTLARVIVLDQFSRNLHRGSPQAFAQDRLALELATAAIDAGRDRELLPIERVFLYMPLEHAEDIALQDRSVACFNALVAEVEPQLRDRFESFASFADSHREVIARFGRFPHRNAVLGRASSDEERSYMEAGAPDWGQGNGQ